MQGELSTTSDDPCAQRGCLATFLSVSCRLWPESSSSHASELQNDHNAAATKLPPRRGTARDLGPQKDRRSPENGLGKPN